MKVVVVERRKWSKFGDCKGLPPGPEPNITHRSTERIALDLRIDGADTEPQPEAPLLAKLGALQNQVIKCSLCGQVYIYLSSLDLNCLCVGGSLDAEMPKAKSARTG